MIRACAILAAYNEADIIRESVTKLIAQGVDVYLIDNASSDGMAEQVQDLVGRGVIDIACVRYTDNDREYYDWTALLRLKEELSRRLGYDWYLHVDADEIRYAPWPGLSLREGFDRVNAAGYNLVNFKLFNFRLTEDIERQADYESAMPLYSRADYFNQRHVKAWKAAPEVDIACLGGHQIRIPGGIIHPTRFILKHYPVRSLEHGRRKILKERKERFSKEECRRGWHYHYNHLTDIDPRDVFWEPDQLVPFDRDRESLALLTESSAVLSQMMRDLSFVAPALQENNFDTYWTERLRREGVEPERAAQLISVARGLVRLLSAQQEIPPIASSQEDAQVIRRILESLARVRYLAGDTLLYDRLPYLRFR